MLKAKTRLPRRKRASGPHVIGVRTRIARATGQNGRYAIDAIRALPAGKDGVILQATDGHQAVCVLAHGEVASPRLVPCQVLPTRRQSDDVMIRLVGDRWESDEGRVAPDATHNHAFPAVGEVLPAVGTKPHYETAKQAEKRAQAEGQATSAHVALGVNLDLLRKTAEALGTFKLTLLIPVPIKHDNTKPADLYVNKPVAVCPASNEPHVRGIAAVMPLTPERSHGYYEQVRDLVCRSEKQAAAGVRSGSAPGPGRGNAKSSRNPKTSATTK